MIVLLLVVARRLLKGRGPAGAGLYTSRGGQGVEELVSGSRGDDGWGPGGSGRVVVVR
jgi:hypothetical protein